MSRDPFNNNNNRNGPHDPFDDPFFRQFGNMSRHMDRIFDEFFNHGIPQPNGDDRPTIIIERHPGLPNGSSQSPRNSEDNRPHLSQINPNINPSSPDSPGHDMNRNDNNNNNTIERHRPQSHHHGFPNDPMDIFRNFFDLRPHPIEYQGPSLSDINPDMSGDNNNNQIINDKNKDSNLIHPNGPPPGFRSPYLPNWNGAEESIENEINNNGNIKQFFRSQSVVISTGPDGKTTKRTMIRDENGNVEESTETFDNMNDATGGRGIGFGGFGGFDFPRMLGWGPFGRGMGNNGSDGDNINSMPSRDDIIRGDGSNNDNNPWVMRPNDPFGKWRPMIDGWKEKWKGKLFGYNNNGNNNNNNDNNGNNNTNNWRSSRNNNNNNNQEWFWGYRNNNNNNNNNSNINNNNEVKATKIDWKDSKNYRRPGRGDASKLRDEIIKPNNNNNDNNE